VRLADLLEVDAEQKSPEEQNDRHEEHIMAIRQPLGAHSTHEPHQGSRAVLPSDVRVPERAHPGGVADVGSQAALSVGEQEAAAVSLPNAKHHPPVVRSANVNAPESSERLVDEHQPDERRENLCCKSREEFGNGADVQGDEDEHEESAPQPDPHPELQERDSLLAAELRHQLLHDEGGARGTEHHKRLAGEDGVEQVSETHSKDRLRSTLQRNGHSITDDICTHSNPQE